MPSRDENLGITPRRDLHVFYVLDTSGSMEGTPIQILNRAMLETIGVLKKVAKTNGDAQLKLSVMEFSTMARWMQKAGPEDVEDFVWMDLSAGGLTNVGAALKELNHKLSRDEFLKSSSGTMLPIIIFMTDGYATDEYEKELEAIKQNKLFRRATKIGFAIGDNPDVEMITHLAGDSEAVVHTDDLALFARLLRFVSVSSSTLASTSQVAGNVINTGREAVREALREEGIDAQQVRPDIEYVDEDTVLLNETRGYSSGGTEWDNDDDDW